MAMQTAIHEKLKELLKDDKDLLKNVVDWHNGNEAMEKVQTANTEITKERDELKETAKTQKTELETSITTLKEKEAEVKRLQEGQLSDEDKKKLEQYTNKGMSDAVEATLNTIKEKLESVETELATTKEERKSDKEALVKAEEDKAKASQRVTLTTALAEAKIIGDSAEMALSYITSQGLAKLTKPENGEGFKENYVIMKDGKPYEATAKELAEHFASTHENLVSSSGNTGSGGSHGSDTKTDQNTTKGSNEDLSALRSNADKMLNA